MKILSRAFQLGRLKFSLMLASSRKCGDLSLFSIYRSCKMYSLMAGDSLVTLCSGSANVQSNFPRTYQVVVAATRDMGIGKDGKLPWKLPSDLKFFKELTSTTSDHGKKNAVLMGRKTWESIPPHSRPLPGRLNVVLTRSGGFNVASAENVITCGSISSALELLASTPYCLLIDKVFVIGGGQILREARNGPGCVAVHMTEINASIDCDTFIPPVHDSVFRPWYSSPPLVENSIRYCFVTYVRAQRSAIESVAPSIGVKYNNNSDSNKVKVEDFTFLPKMIFEKHDEFMYLKLVQDVISGSTQKDDPSGTRTLSKFGCQMHFNLRKTFPLLTTKRVSWRNVVEEFLCFIRGSTNAKVLQEKDIQIRDGNATGDCHESIGSGQCNESDSGSIDGFQSRHFGASVQGFDQLLEIINKVKNKPDDGRIILSAWNPSDLSLMALPPCHMFAQFYVANGEVSCQMYQASADIGLGVPFTITSYALLTCMVAHVSGLVPGDFIHVIGDVHVNKTHIRPLQQQLEKPPRPFPSLHINPEKQDVDSFVAADFKLVGYDPHDGI